MPTDLLKGVEEGIKYSELYDKIRLQLEIISRINLKNKLHGSTTAKSEPLEDRINELRDCVTELQRMKIQYNDLEYVNRIYNKLRGDLESNLPEKYMPEFMNFLNDS